MEVVLVIPVQTGACGAIWSHGSIFNPGKQRLLSDHSLLKGFAPPALPGS